MNICLKDFGVVCALGHTKQQVLDNLISGQDDFLQTCSKLPINDTQFVGKAKLPESPSLAHIVSDNNKLAYIAYQQISETLKPLIKRYGNDRVAVIIGTSTSGIYEGEQARKYLNEFGEYPADFHYEQQEMFAPAHFIANLCQAMGPIYSISTACSSSGKAFASAKYLLESDMVDVAIVGGVDSLAGLTLNGFNSLESISKAKCAPFSASRDGINIGEAAALFVLCKDSQGIQLLGVGESSDAHHISAPDPTGEGAVKSMQLALNDANIAASQIDYINLHGTGTVQNDLMESGAVNQLFSEQVLCSSTKHLTGHTLGAAGALEIGFCWLILNQSTLWKKQNQHDAFFLPANAACKQIDPKIAPLNLVLKSLTSKGSCLQKSTPINTAASANTHQAHTQRLTYCLSNSFAFGGNNFSMVIGGSDESL